MDRAGTPLPVSVVVLNWNGHDDTVDCVESLLAQEPGPLEVWVVDNASEGGEADRLSARFGDRIRLLRNDANLGFTGGNNVAMRRVLDEGRAEWVALLNNDAVAEAGWLAALHAAGAAEPGTGVLASKMLFHDDPGRIENTGVVLLTSGEALPRDRGRPAGARPRPDRPIGACAGAAMYRCAMLREVGLFRDEYFANFEDVELSLRALARGWDTRYVPGARVRHRLSRSIRKVRDEAFLLRSQRNLLHATWTCLPAQVLALNAPWILFGLLCQLLLAPLVGQRLLARVIRRSRLELWRRRGEIRAARRELAPLRRGPWLRFWWRQRNPLPAYLASFWAIVVRRERRFFE
ncbi:MAG: glycosyltransferase family 2 protein [Planctomycetota bacterium]